MATVLSLALAAWLIVDQASSLTSPAVENSLPKSIEITTAFCGIGCVKPQKYQIDVVSNKGAVTRLLAALELGPMKEPSLDNLGIIPHWLDAAKHKSYTRFDGRTLDKRQKAFFSRLFADERKADAWMKFEYRGRLIRTDDYPSVAVTMRWLDGATFNLASSEQTVYMLPWKLGVRKTQTFNANISRALADLLPANALNRERLAGDTLADEYATFLMGDSEDTLNRMNVEDTLGVQLLPLYKDFRIDTLALQSISSDDLDGEYALQAHVRLKSVPATNEFLNMTLFMAGAHKLVNVTQAVAAAQKYQHLVARVPWIQKYLRLHKDTSAEIRVVQDRSVSRQLAASLLADLREHGKTALAHRLKSSIPGMAFFYLNGPNQAYARWFALPDLTTLLWNYKGSTPLQQQIRRFPTWDWSGHVGVGALFSPDGVVLAETGH
jgi:hypothetical protein